MELEVRLLKCYAKLKPIDQKNIYTYTFQRLLSCTTPAPYKVQMALAFGNFIFSAPSEKSNWKVILSYEGEVFSLSDWKGYEWDIWSETDSQMNQKRAQEIRNQISKAWKVVEETLIPALEAERNKRKFLLNNPYRTLKDLYDFHAK